MRSHHLRKVTPHTQASVSPPPPQPKEGWTHSPVVGGVGGSHFGRLDKKPSTLSTLCYVQKTIKSAKWILLYNIQCTQNLCGHINSVKSLSAVTPTPYIECTQLVQKILLLNWTKRHWPTIWGGGVESRLIWSAVVNWRFGWFFYLILKGLHQKINKKPWDAA